MELSVLGDSGLNKESGRTWIDPNSQPIDHHINHILFEYAAVTIMGGKGMPVGDEKEALIFVL
jgi:hypothetical protein